MRLRRGVMSFDRTLLRCLGSGLACALLALAALTTDVRAAVAGPHGATAAHGERLIMDASGFVSGRSVEPLGTLNRTNYYLVIRNTGRHIQSGRISFLLPHGLAISSFEEARLSGRSTVYQRSRCRQLSARHTVCHVSSVGGGSIEARATLRATRLARYGERVRAMVQLVQGFEVHGTRYARLVFTGRARLHIIGIGHRPKHLSSDRSLRIPFRLVNYGPRPACGAMAGLFTLGARGSLRLVHMSVSEGRALHYAPTDMLWELQCLDVGQSVHAVAVLRSMRPKVHGDFVARASSLAGDPQCLRHPRRCPANASVRVVVGS